MNVLITGCSRGIGLGLTQQILERTNAKVIATSRDPDSSERLQNLLKHYGEERLLLPRLDVMNEENFSQLKDELKGQGINSIDILLGNAGVAPDMEEKKTVLSSAPDEMKDAFETNVLGNMRLIQTFHDMLCESTVRLAVLMSSSHGSLTVACSSQGSLAAYRCSKAALNMMSVLYAVDPVVRESGVKVIIFHPGWVKTDMGWAGGPAKTDVEEATSGLLELIERAVHLQLAQFGESKKVDSSAASTYEFKHDAAEIESKGHLDRFVEYLQHDNFAYVKFDGTMMEW